MASCKVIILRKAISNISEDIAFKNRWVRCSSLLTALQARYVLKEVSLTKASISRVVSKLEPDISNLDFVHSSGIYSGLNTNERYYWFQGNHLDPPTFPAIRNNNLVWESIRCVDSKKLDNYLKRISREHSNRRSSKRPRLDDVDIFDNIARSEECINSSVTKSVYKMTKTQVVSYWTSPEAYILFGVSKSECVIKTLIIRDKMLAKAAYDDDTLVSLLTDVDSVDKLSSYQKQHLRFDCIYLKKLYEVAIQNMNSWTWQQCAQAAIAELNDAGFNHIKNERTLRNLNMRYRVNQKLAVPFSISTRKPFIFLILPEMRNKIVIFCNQQVKEGTLSTDCLQSEIKKVILKEAYSEYIAEHNNSNNDYVIPTYSEFLSILHLKSVSLNTVHRWMLYLGYEYSETKKTYYTDGHERADVIEDRDFRFLNRYFEYELRCHRWVHIKRTDAVLLGKDNPSFAVDACYRFKIDDIDYNEYHMDTHICLQFDDHKPFDYKISIRKPAHLKPLIIFGQDESTYHQFVFSNKNWKSDTGASQIQPKGLGEILMVSGFQSRETGLGLGTLLTDLIRSKVNENRKGSKYISKEDANLVNSSDLKKDIFDDPLLRYFHAGANKDGYWTSSHAKLQLEDCLDFLAVIFPNYDYLFLYDQSSGHTKMRDDGLLVSNMNISYGGAVNTMHDSVIKELDKFNSKLTIGEVQKMNFTKHDRGPFWLSPLECIKSKYDKIHDSTIKKDKTKIELLVELRRKGVDTTSRRYLKEELIKLSENNNISIFTTNKKIDKGWCGAPKGMLQVLYERGHIDATKVKNVRSSRYSKNGKKEDYHNDTGLLKEECKQYSLTYMLSRCSDFKNEITDLEHLTKVISEQNHIKSNILFTPKFHCELAGEGIEYSWGASKRVYRRYPLKRKRFASKFEACVKRSISLVTPLMANRFSAKARSYMMGYKHRRVMIDECENTDNDIIVWSHDYNEKIHKIYRGHRDANTIEGHYIEKVLKECIQVKSLNNV